MALWCSSCCRQVLKPAPSSLSRTASEWPLQASAQSQRLLCRIATCLGSKIKLFVKLVAAATHRPAAYLQTGRSPTKSSGAPLLPAPLCVRQLLTALLNGLELENSTQVGRRLTQRENRSIRWASRVMAGSRTAGRRVVVLCLGSRANRHSRGGFWESGGGDGL